MKNSSSYANKITRQDMEEAVDILNSVRIGKFIYINSRYGYHIIKDEQDVTILNGNTKRELYGKIQAFMEGVIQQRFYNKRKKILEITIKDKQK